MPSPPGRRLSVVLLAALGLMLAPSAATPAGQITIYGAASGSHLRLSKQGPHLVVKGRMAGVHQHRCRYTRGHLAAVCRLRGASRIEVTTGPSGDFVRVADPLPVPLTVYLGSGSDKFVGNGEPDTCYLQGSRRNRCIGNGGDDVCITGQKNSDCVGGAGNDYCHTGRGSDGCWGGRGRDVCVMGPGEDGCHGEGGNDRLYGGAGADRLYGGQGFNYCDGSPGRGKSRACATGPRH
jgi:RTX calcium-binding nonapeptide repeat (4 copies)